MSETIIPDAPQNASDVLESQELNLSEKTLAEIIAVFENLKCSADAMTRSKEAEAIKAAFYRKLNKEKTDEDPLEAIEEGFKSLYADYKARRAEYNREQEAAREENLRLKLAVIEDLRALVDGQEDVSSTFPAFREIQNRWREVGQVPAQRFRDVNDSYQFLVEKFYDMVKIDRDLRDLDFKKNHEAKLVLCDMAEKLSENENVIEAFRELQKLHERWKEFGPVAKEYREQIWDRFKEATSIINKKYQAHFQNMKSQQAENLRLKAELCEKLEAIAAKAEEGIESSNLWNSLSSEIEALQAEWKKIGFATKSENQKIYERFRAACDSFFAKKRDFYAVCKDRINENLEKKMSLVERAEALKDSTEWKAATEEFIELQKKWKEIGAVPRKKSEQIWKRFHAACDEFFAEKEKALKQDSPRHYGQQGYQRQNSASRSPKDALVRKYNALQQEIANFENNIGFFTVSKNAESLIAQMREKIEEGKKELRALEEKIRNAEKEQN